MILADSGPLYALLDHNDQYHHVCANIAHNILNQTLITTWPCFTEVLYFLGVEGGFRYQEKLWNLRRDGKLVLAELTQGDGDRIYNLMQKYRDVPMDLADASLLAVAESTNTRIIFTLDNDFYIYQLADGSMLEVLKAPDGK